MKIQKFLHSCLLIEEGSTRILIDPGGFSFFDRGAQVSQLPHIDAILLTHKHPDHCDPAVLKQIITRDSSTVYCNREIGYHLDEAGVRTESIDAPKTFSIGSCSITATHTNHGALPVPIPENTAFFINERVLHPGDSHTFEKDISGHPEVLALPITAPWGTTTTAVEVALRLKPKYVIPIHDGIITDTFLPRLHQMCKTALEKEGIIFCPLKLGEILEI